jgi:hypothetical protein
MYSIASKLTHSGTESATVLTGEKVMVTQGLGKGQIMSLEDWLILADENEITVVQKSKAAPKVEEIPVGTKFKWVKDIYNYRVAIQTKKGFLQVVEVMNGMCIQAKVPKYYEMEGRRGPETFTSYYVWAKALPPGNIIRTEADNTSTFQKKVASSHRSHKL